MDGQDATRPLRPIADEAPETPHDEVAPQTPTETPETRQRRGAHRELAASPAGRSEATGLTPREAVYCPECGMPAWVEWSDIIESTSGPLELAKVRCFARHWFLMPADQLPR